MHDARALFQRHEIVGYYPVGVAKVLRLRSRNLKEQGLIVETFKLVASE